jgi:hypothetical protein
MAIGLGTSGAHERRVAPVPPVVPIPIVWPATHSERGIVRLGPTHSCPSGNSPDCASNGHARDASDADHHCPDTPGVLRSNEQARQPPDGDTGEEDQLTHLATHWVPSVARGAEKAICLVWRSASLRKRHRKPLSAPTRSGRSRLSKLTYQAADDVEAWTVYRALAEPSEALGGQTPAAIANRGNVDAIAHVVLASLGVQPAERAGADV